MKKEQLKTKLKTLPIIRILGKLQLIFLLILLSSPFVWIWYDGYFSFKIALTGIFGVFVSYFLYRIFQLAINKVVDEYEEPDFKHKSKFQQRLEEMAKKKKESL